MTKIIDGNPAIAEASSRLAGIEISAIRKVISTSECAEKVVVAGINRRISDDEKCGG